ncbi:pyruvate formate-lyase-activating protein [Sporolactobacillus inulinus]|uniref:Pyruvate formate-lyase-activating enzyme n=1 Tax=Sporolactobacillus inulinus CASD TaxID=1069536 RepID=A0A0U1QNU8_9BACL|nr:pyruvate formate-lyase-activating protein [Sporolactobacillus inulinus]KLI02296.1 pyruvate formate lyase-activating protein [Sporolactobacillus inulinus CASD]GEB75825.1 pyruvate formate-lyase-activating enzyme [Sporolactobacillus inulinus]
MVLGNIHSIESFGTVDGPGIRFVVFTQGCPLRCKYCHNVDTRPIGTGKQVTVDEIIRELKDYLPFIQSSGGGITVSGGEALLQIPFLIELFRACKAIGVHTALDTSGCCYVDAPFFHQKFDQLAEVTDLVLLDIKEINSERHKWLTGQPNERILAFARLLAKKQIPVWIRHVLVPTITDSADDLTDLGAFIDTLDNVERVEILPYHKMGVFKWKANGLDYPLEGIEPPTNEEVTRAAELIQQKLHRPLVAAPQ